MFEPGVVTHGFAKNIANPKNKYAISLFRDDNVRVLIHFTTSQPRAGVPDDQIHHGANKNAAEEYMSYVFEAGVEIGTAPDGSRFCFPKRTIMQFDYGFLRDTDWNLQQQFSKCHLDENIYLDLIYAMYRSKRTPNEYKSYLKKVLDDAYNG